MDAYQFKDVPLHAVLPWPFTARKSQLRAHKYNKVRCRVIVFISGM